MRHHMWLVKPEEAFVWFLNIKFESVELEKKVSENLLLYNLLSSKHYFINVIITLLSLKHHQLIKLYCQPGLQHYVSVTGVDTLINNLFCYRNWINNPRHVPYAKLTRKLCHKNMSMSQCPTFIKAFKHISVCLHGSLICTKIVNHVLNFKLL